MIHIDIETLCRLNVKDVGVYRYVRDPSFRIVLLSYAVDDGDVVTLDCYHEDYPGQMIYEYARNIWNALHDPGEEFWAHNAAFEMVCISAAYGIELHRGAWWCTMVTSAYLGLPMGLKDVAKVLKLPEQKLARGTALITLFSAPQKTPKKKYDFAEWITPEVAPLEWEEYKQYNAQDVRTERDVHKYCTRFPMLSRIEHEYWIQNEEINAAGVYVDLEFVHAAIDVCKDFLEGVFNELRELTGCTNPNSDPQLKAWIEAQGVNIPSLNKDYLKDHVDPKFLPDHVNRALELRARRSKTSISKYDKMVEMADPDDCRIRGVHQYFGARPTGRFAGRGIQGQNLKKTFSNADNISANAKRLGVSYAAVEAVTGNALLTAKEAIRNGVGGLIYSDVTDIVSKLVRTAIIPPPGYSLIPCDFASIEARMLAFAAGEEWALEEFRGEGKIYEATAARMYNMRKEDITKGSDERARGKIATLALGYQGGEGALITSGALRAGMTEEELPGVKNAYRKANPMTVRFWRRVEDAARYVIKNKVAIKVPFKYITLKFSFERGNLFITLPSGRRMCYHSAHVDSAGYRIRYWGMRQMKDSTATTWTTVDLYGGLITENIIQAMARDCLVEVMYRMRGNVLIVLHVHDEIIAEVRDEDAAAALVYIEHEMSISPLWAKELPLAGDGYITKYYRKD